jgi:predicted ABC-type ATPase
LAAAPVLLVIAGPNGSGKSTLTEFLRGLGYEFGTYINPDEIAATLELPEPDRSRRAQALADLQRDSCLTSRVNFSFETVMSHPSKIEFMSRARDAGYEVRLLFVCTSDPEINTVRVRQRVYFGGHDVPEDRIRARYQRTLELLSRAAALTHRTVLFDNTAELDAAPDPNPLRKKGLRPVADLTVDGNVWRVALEQNPPRWATENLVDPLTVAALASNGRIKLVVDQRNGPL